MNYLIRFFLLAALILPLLAQVQGSCDYSINLISIDMSTFYTKAFNPLNPLIIYDRLNSLRGSILAAYLICWNKTIPDPDSMYPQNLGECLHGLYNVSLFNNKYVGNPVKIKTQIDSIAKIVFSTQNDCRPVLNYSGWDNFTQDCKSMIPELGNLFNQYEEEIILNKNGLQYINSMILLTERLRKLCGFNILNKANNWIQDKCQAANNEWLYPLVDQIDTCFSQTNYKNFTRMFYHLYQTLYRVKSVCNVSLEEFSNKELIKNQATSEIQSLRKRHQYIEAKG